MDATLAESRTPDEAARAIHSAMALATSEDWGGAAMAAGERVLGRPIRAATPTIAGGAVRLALDDGTTAIAKQRATSQRAEIEAALVGALRAKGAPVPAVLGWDGAWLIEQDLGADTLVQRLDTNWEAEGERWLQLALVGLVQIHTAAAACNLGTRAFAIGEAPGWQDALLATPARLAEFLGLPLPPLDLAEIARHLDASGTSFVKWEALPHSAVAQSEWTVSWCDFEHAGRRNRMDDMVSLLAGEHVPDWPVVEERLIRRYLKYFDEGGYRRGAATYLLIAGVFHMSVRLSTIIKRMMRDGSWAYQVDQGATQRAPLEVRRLCARAARWSAQTPSLLPLATWWREVAQALQAE